MRRFNLLNFYTEFPKFKAVHLIVVFFQTNVDRHTHSLLGAQECYLPLI